MDNTNILLAGLHASGKTTFIAALWFAVCEEMSNMSWKVNEVAEGDNEYLYRISIAWAKFQEVGRTNLNENNSVSLNLKDAETGDLLFLKVPDLSGESFKSHFDLREWSLEFDELLDNANGVLLFVDPLHKNNTPKLLYQSVELEKILGDVAIEGNGLDQDKSDDDEELSTELKKNKEEDWSVEFVPNQVKLVELLQFIFYHKPQLLPLKLGVVISRWDRILDLGQNDTPAEWLSKNLPLLYQFLETNKNYFNSKIFGVSAQGCEYKDEKKMEALFEKTALERISVQEETESTNDISKPITWLVK